MIVKVKMIILLEGRNLEVNVSVVYELGKRLLTKVVAKGYAVVLVLVEKGTTQA